MHPDSLYHRARLLGLAAVGVCGPDDLGERYAGGVSSAVLAGELGVSRRTVLRWLAYRGVELRPRGRPAAGGARSVGPEPLSPPLA